MKLNEERVKQLQSGEVVAFVLFGIIYAQDVKNYINNKRK